MMEISILMPCLNEAETLALCIKKAQKWLKNSELTGEILVADNGSTDGSQEIATLLGARVVEVSERGYGSALYHGAFAAKGKWIVMGDSDNSYDFSSLDAFVGGLKSGADLVMGNRFSGGIARGAMPWKNRYIGNPVLTFIGRLLFNCPSRDFHCGLRAFTKEAFLKMDLRTTGMEFASEMVIKANLFRMKILEVPTTLHPDGRSRPPHLRPWRDGWRHLRFMFLFSPKWLFFYPGVVIFLLSLSSYLTLLSGPVYFGNIEFSINTMLVAEAGTIVGSLFLIFSILVRLIGIREGLLPDHTFIEKLRTSSVLEIGGIAGVSLAVFGLFFVFDAIQKWSILGFSHIPDFSLLRIVSISTLMIVLGGMIFLFSMVIGFLSLPTRRN